MGIQLDVPVGHLRRRLADDGGAVDQAHDRHERPALAVRVGSDEHRMAVREAQVAGGQPRTEGAGADAHGLLIVRQRRALAVEIAVADPGDRTQQARGGDGQIADAQILDRDLAPGGPDEGAGREAGRRLHVVIAGRAVGVGKEARPGGTGRRVRADHLGVREEVAIVADFRLTGRDGPAREQDLARIVELRRGQLNGGIGKAGRSIGAIGHRDRITHGIDGARDADGIGRGRIDLEVSGCTAIIGSEEAGRVNGVVERNRQSHGGFLPSSAGALSRMICAEPYACDELQGRCSNLGRSTVSRLGFHGLPFSHALAMMGTCDLDNPSGCALGPGT